MLSRDGAQRCLDGIGREVVGYPEPKEEHGGLRPVEASSVEAVAQRLCLEIDRRKDWKLHRGQWQRKRGQLLSFPGLGGGVVHLEHPQGLEVFLGRRQAKESGPAPRITQPGQRRFGRGGPRAYSLLRQWKAHASWAFLTPKSETNNLLDPCETGPTSTNVRRGRR